MKTNLLSPFRRPSGFALMLVLCIVAVSLIILAATLNRTRTVANLNSRSNQRIINQAAAEAAVEKVYARLAYDFAAYGPGLVVSNLALYRTFIPTAAEDGFWSNFVFSDAQSNTGRTYVMLVTNYSGALPTQYSGRSTVNAPVYRIISNVENSTGFNSLTGTAQIDVLLALVPLTTYAIFYNGLLEFSTAATMSVNGRVHSNARIYSGSGSTAAGATTSNITFNDTVTASDTLTGPKNNGQGPWSNLGKFNGSPTYRTNVPSVSLSINMTNTYSLIEQPPAGESVSSQMGKERMINKAQVVLLVSNSVVTARIQSGMLPGDDSSPSIITSATNTAALATNFPFLSLTNKFRDQREDKDIYTVQIDVAKYSRWLATNTTVQSKFSGSDYPTIMYVANNRTQSSGQLNAVRLVNGADLPKNGNLGWSVATPNPLYVLGDYNVTNSTVSHPNYRASTNTTKTVPAALMGDALTLLSSSWNDATSFTTSETGPTPSSTITVNAAILAGIVPSTGNTSSTFSGGVHNLPRLLENWTTSRKVWLNTSIINLFNSQKATGVFVTPGTGSYYVAPTRQFSFDQNFRDPNKQPPGIPNAMVAIRFNWATPPPNTLTYNATP